MNNLKITENKFEKNNKKINVFNIFPKFEKSKNIFNNFFPTIFPNYYNNQIKEEIINYQINLISENFQKIKEKKDKLKNFSKEDILINNNLLSTYDNYIRKNGEFINFGDNYYTESEDEKSESDSNGENNSKNTYPENESESEHNFYNNSSENDYDDYDNNNDYFEKSNPIEILKKNNIKYK